MSLALTQCQSTPFSRRIHVRQESWAAAGMCTWQLYRSPCPLLFFLSLHSLFLSVSERELTAYLTLQFCSAFVLLWPISPQTHQCRITKSNQVVLQSSPHTNTKQPAPRASPSQPGREYKTPMLSRLAPSVALISLQPEIIISQANCYPVIVSHFRSPIQLKACPSIPTFSHLSLTLCLESSHLLTEYCGIYNKPSTTS